MPELRVIEHQDTWTSQYALIAAELQSAMPAHGILLEHIGSTAVPGLCAKPVLDIALGVRMLDEVAASLPELARLGFTYRPEYEQQIPDRRYFTRAEGPMPRVHLHALILGGALWTQHLRLRDALREDQVLAQAYAALKQRLAVPHAHGKAAYTEAKAPFIRLVLAGRPRSAHP